MMVVAVAVAAVLLNIPTTVIMRKPIPTTVLMAMIAVTGMMMLVSVILMVILAQRRGALPLPPGTGILFNAGSEVRWVVETDIICCTGSGVILLPSAARPTRLQGSKDGGDSVDVGVFHITIPFGLLSGCLYRLPRAALSTVSGLEAPAMASCDDTGARQWWRRLGSSHEVHAELPRDERSSLISRPIGLLLGSTISILQVALNLSGINTRRYHHHKFCCWYPSAHGVDPFAYIIL